MQRSFLAAALLAALLSACRTTASQPPTWAFGMTLGEVLDKNTAQPVDALLLGRALYRVRPPAPHRAMSDYALLTDQATGVILGVVGWDRYSSGEACQRERRALAQALERRYGAGRSAEAADRTRMRGLPDTFNAPELTVFPGAVGWVSLGCAGERLLVGYWGAAEGSGPTVPKTP